LVRLWPIMGERLNRWSDFREILTQSCVVSFVRIVSVESYLAEWRKWISACTSHISRIIWVKLVMGYLHVTLFSAGGFRGNRRGEGRASPAGENEITFTCVQRNTTTWHFEIALWSLCTGYVTLHHCVHSYGATGDWHRHGCVVAVVLCVLSSYVYLLYCVGIAVFYFRCRTAG